ncbi:hypothetical protein KEM55_006113 [Ascosphaera atra]|nr:hypothetical protein KEM55_006113 [Ascosphaera atra]
MAPKRKQTSSSGDSHSTFNPDGRSAKQLRSGPVTSDRSATKQLQQLPRNDQVDNFVPSSLYTDDDYGSQSDTDMDSVSEGIAVPPVGGSKETKEWLSTIEKVVKAVVSIHFCQAHSFDTEGSSSSQATGFVVDAERGLILTNRHVVSPGPFVGYVIFDNHEETDVHPIYRDPVHDFGFLRFDPKAIKYMTLNELSLAPESARVGTEIRVVGNDAGEKLSILSGVISRLDRNAPDYGEGYCDFNTNYIQAAAAASGGSSGSPVVDRHANVVALQAGGRCDGATTDYFLPLARPLRALQCIQKKIPVTRGTIQTQWLLKPFDECRRLGLTSEWEAIVREAAPKETGMLVCEVALPEGPADGQLKEGDVLIKVNGELLTQFVKLDDILDSSVGKEVELLVQRNGEDVTVKCTVGDLHAITPDRYVTVSGATIHDLSYQQARLYAVPVKGVYLCEGAGSFHIENRYSGWLIDTVDNRPTPTLKEFIEVMKTVPDRARIALTYRHLSDLHIRGTGIVTVDRHWQPAMRLAVRNDETGLWDFTDLGKPLPAEPEL